MLTNEEAFFKELLSMFKIEAEEHLKSISSGLLQLEKSRKAEEQTQIVETIYREAHSLKGAARAVNLMDVETICQTVETIFSALKHQKMNLVPELFDVLHQSVDTIGEVIDASKKIDISEIMQKLGPIEAQAKTGKKESAHTSRPQSKPESQPPKETVSTPNDESPKESTVPEKPPEVNPVVKETPQPAPVTIEVDKSLVSDTIRISTAKLDSLLLQAEEMVGAKLTVVQQGVDLRNIVGSLGHWRKDWEKKEGELRETFQLVEKKGTDNGSSKMLVSQFLDFVTSNLTAIKETEETLINLTSMTETNARTLGNMLDNMLEDMKKVLMLPFSTLLRILPKVVRDLSRDQGKDVELIVKGSTIEIDRRILEELKDPFIHILRNCIDHGLEKPEDRVKSKKPRGGTISILISQLSGKEVEILIMDDGRGIDASKVREVAVKKGVISQAKADALDEQEALMLIFQSEVSTSPIITDLSGRGLGLPIVREKVEKLGGTIAIETKVGEGTTFRIVLPVTLAKFRGILVTVQDQAYVIPTGNVERVIRFRRDEIKQIERKDSLVVDGRVIGLLRLQDVLGLTEKKAQADLNPYMQALVLVSGDQRLAFCIDRVMNEQEVLVKNFGQQLVRVRNIAGATILGTGKVVAILNVPDLLKSATQVTTAAMASVKMEGEILTKKRILIAEDSITSRTLLKNILESAGYHVKTSVDGMDALSALKTETFDLVVSDIEMPRMNGFDLVSKIRSDTTTAELPVVLVTALESREDRERGIDVGANAYIVKRSFDQSNLLDVIKKLI